MADDDGITMRETARRLGVSAEAVSKAVRTGRIPRMSNGKMSWHEVQRSWNAQRHPGRGPATNGDDAGVYHKARAAKEVAQARMADLDYKERAGELVDAEQVRLDVFGMTRRVRDRLLSAAARLAPLVTGMTRREVYRAIEQEMREACDELSQPEGKGGKGGKRGQRT